ncbi:MAG: chorismate mutase [Mycoplasmataceae bacterium]|jgi:chorismate mutase|nr:chorismate mutase [Mycoplasmataceae bacterium]
MKKTDPQAQINTLRQEIDLCDTAIVTALIKRYQVTAAIGKIKKDGKQPVRNKLREQQLMDKIVTLSKDQIDVKTLKGIYKQILKHSRRLQKVL